MFRRNAPAAGWLVAGLGNPGAKYRGTRHNAGFAAVDELAALLHAAPWRKKFQAEIAACTLDGTPVLLMKPQTYMNLSGDAIAAARRFYRLDPAHIIVLSDDISLPVGRIRVRAEGGAGGHNGLKSIIAQLGTQAFPRVRIGVGPKLHPEADLADHVLSGFPPEERPVMAESCRRAAEAAAEIMRSGVERAACQFNPI